MTIKSGDVHSEVKRVSYFINDKSYYTPDNESHTVSGTLDLGYSTYNIQSKTANDSVTIDSSYYFSARCGGGSKNPNCGTYALTADANDVIIQY